MSQPGRSEGGAIYPPSSGLTKEQIQELRQHGMDDLYFLAKGILGYADLTPRVHVDFCNWLMDKSKKRKLGLMPRSHFKTTLEMAEIIRTLLNDPERRILLVSESAENAEYMLREIAGHFENNDLFRALYHDRIPPERNRKMWNKQSILIPRKGTYREPSVDTAGITTKVVSRHYTDIFGDDLISNEAMESPSIMKKSIAFVNRMVSLLVNPKTDNITLVGTRWAFHDIYSHVMSDKSYNVFVRKAIVMGETGPEPLFKERFTMEMFQSIIEKDPHQWSTQYANDPTDALVMDFNPKWLQYFYIKDQNIIYEEDNIHHVIPLDELTFYIHCDPSLGETPESDYSGIVVVGLDYRGNVYIVDAVALRLDPLSLVNKLVDLYEYWHPRLLSFESNAGFKMTIPFIEKEARERGTYTRVESFIAPSNKNKPARIRGALQPLFASQKIWVQRGLTVIIDEYLQFGKSVHQHVLDALAQGPNYWITPVSFAAKRNFKRQQLARRPTLGVTGYGA